MIHVPIHAYIHTHICGKVGLFTHHHNLQDLDAALTALPQTEAPCGVQSDHLLGITLGCRLHSMPLEITIAAGKAGRQVWSLVP